MNKEIKPLAKIYKKLSIICAVLTIILIPIFIIRFGQTCTQGTGLGIGVFSGFSIIFYLIYRMER